MVDPYASAESELPLAPGTQGAIIDDGQDAEAVGQLRVIGAMCFSICIWHVPIFIGLYPDWISLRLLEIAKSSPLYLIAVLIVSSLSYRFIEFGRQPDWQSLFLMSKYAPSLQAKQKGLTIIPVEAPPKRSSKSAE